MRCYSDVMNEPLFAHGPKTDAGLHVLGRPIGLVLMVLYKALWGVLELVAGILIMFSSRLIAGELIEDPQDLFINWLLRQTHVSVSSGMWLGAVVGLLGVGKLLLAFGLWHRSYAVRNFGVVFFAMLAVFGAYEVLLHFSLFKLAALAVDVFILYYFWRILPKHFRHGEIE